MIMVYDNGQSYSDHSIEFYDVDPLTIEDCKRLVFLLGTRSGPFLPGETPVKDDIPFIRGFVEKVEWFPILYTSLGKHPVTTDYNQVHTLEELVGSYHWFSYHSSVAMIFEELYTDDRRPNPDYMRELKSLLVRIGLKYPWFKEIQ